MSWIKPLTAPMKSTQTYKRCRFCMNYGDRELGCCSSDSLSTLSQLRKLSLHSNNFNGSIPSSLSQCLLLRAVTFTTTHSPARYPRHFLNLTNLQVLNVAHNFLFGGIPGDLSKSLRFLDFSSNAFTGDMPGNFSSKSQLQLINLSYNRFSGEIPVTIGVLEKLEYL